jgi:iron complex outermembrane receptor protein
VARTSFDIVHFTDRTGELRRYRPASASQSETPFTPKAGMNYTPNNDNLFYATYAKGFRDGGANAPLPSYCSAPLMGMGYPSGQAPPTYKSDSTQSFEIGAKDNFNNVFKLASSIYYIRWNNIQQSVYVTGGCGLQFTDNLGTAVSKGFDLQAEAALGPIALEAAVGLTARASSTTPRTILR